MKKKLRTYHRRDKQRKESERKRTSTTRKTRQKTWNWIMVPKITKQLMTNVFKAKNPIFLTNPFTKRWCWCCGVSVQVIGRTKWRRKCKYCSSYPNYTNSFQPIVSTIRTISTSSSFQRSNSLKTYSKWWQRD